LSYHAAMNRRALRVRVVLALLTGLQFVLPGAVAWADARLDSDSARAVAHIESHTSASCVRIHPADCAFHRFLSAPFALGKPVHVGFRVQAYRVLASIAPARGLPAPQERLPDSRAPQLSPKQS
jgi:hypothetical protein